MSRIEKDIDKLVKLSEVIEESMKKALKYEKTPRPKPLKEQL